MQTDGNKKSVTDNSILRHEPTFFRGALRTYTGDSRDDVEIFAIQL